MAKDHSYFRLVGLNVSPNNQYVSYGVDTTGRRQYKLLIKDLKSNKIFKEEVWNTTVLKKYHETKEFDEKEIYPYKVL